MAVWSKTKQQLESFLCESLSGRVEYRATAYRYAADRAGRCYITVDKKEVFNMSDITTLIKWYKTEQEIKNDPDIIIPVSDADIDAVRKDGCNKIPEDKLYNIARSRNISGYAKQIIESQAILSKSDFYAAASMFLSSSVEKCLESNDILLNIFALVDRRVGKKRLQNMKEAIQMKHPIVQYFYNLRLNSSGQTL